MQEDVRACNDVIAMWDYAELAETEKRQPKTMTPEQRRFLIMAEKEAGL